MQRGLSVSPAKWEPRTPLLSSLDGETVITARRLWAAMKRFFAMATVLVGVNPALAEKLGPASPHWLRSHALHTLEAGADFTTVRDKLRHASVSTKSLYLHEAQDLLPQAMRLNPIALAIHSTRTAGRTLVE